MKRLMHRSNWRTRWNRSLSSQPVELVRFRTRQRIRRGVFRSIADLQTAINAYLAEHNASPRPFVWIQSADAILAKLDRLPVSSV